MKKYVVATALFALLIVAASTLYVGVRAGRELLSLRNSLAGDPTDLSAADLDEAQSRVERAREALGGLPAWVLELVPVARQNVRALRDVLEDLTPVLDAAARLRDEAELLESGDLITDRTVDLSALSELTSAVTRQASALASLEVTLQRATTGWLVPPLWDALDRMRERVTAVTDSAERAATLATVLPTLLGEDTERTYVVMLINNAELRGAGGILSGVGALTLRDGKLVLGNFDYYADLHVDTREGLATIPADLDRRFGRYLVDGPVINATASPDVPEVARYVAGLYEEARSRRVEGAIVVDPRGLQAMLDADDAIRVSGVPERIASEDVASFVYSDAYARFEDQSARRDALLDIGPRVIASTLEGGDLDRATFERLGEAVAGGHIRIVSFDPDEAEALEEVDADGHLGDRAQDRVLVTVQNLGADKLDAWIERTVELTCEVDAGPIARCRVEVALHNAAPEGLPLYVVQDKARYARYKGYLEVYIPERAEVTGYSLDGGNAEIFIETEDGRRSVGAYFKTERGGITSAVVTYDLPIGSTFDLALTPQPLVLDANVLVSLEVPDGWRVEGRGRPVNGVHVYRGPLAVPLTLHAAPESDETTGLTRMWRGVRRFWSEPVVRF